MQTPEPVREFIRIISDPDMPSKVASIDRCKEKIETKASARDMFLSVMIFCDVLLRAPMSFTIAAVILAKAYVAIAIIIIILNL